MKADQLLSQLDALEKGDFFPQDSHELMEQWRKRHVGAESIPVILQFIEANPCLDFGMPGALVHFIESLRSSCYVECVIESIRRRPTPHVMHMLHRLINGTSGSPKRRLLDAARIAVDHPLADAQVVECAQETLRYFQRRE